MNIMSLFWNFVWLALGFFIGKFWNIILPAAQAISKEIKRAPVVIKAGVPDKKQNTIEEQAW